jgi:hypothetical protein
LKHPDFKPIKGLTMSTPTISTKPGQTQPAVNVYVAPQPQSSLVLPLKPSNSYAYSSNTMTVPLRLEHDINAKHAQEGDIVSLRTVEDVLDKEGRVVIRANAPASGRIQNIKKNRKHGREGHLTLQINTVEAANGQKVSLNEIFRRAGENRNTKTWAVTIISAFFLFPFNFLFLLMKGGKAKVEAGTIIQAAINRHDLSALSHHADQIDPPPAYGAHEKDQLVSG